jgi:hypothetical protein
MTVVGWILFRTSSLALLSNSEASNTTEVVPSPTSLSCCVARETRIRAYTSDHFHRREERGHTAGCVTSNNDRIVAPSLVIVMSPTLSTNILSNPTGPRDDLRMLDTV